MSQTDSKTNHSIFQPEELFPIVTWLTKKYTQNESSSVSYDTAKQLMQAVIYCIQEFYQTNKHANHASLMAQKAVTCQTAYELGYQKVIEKAKLCRDQYHELIVHFDTYECENYRDTILKGIPAFFLYYDPLYAPQDTILTLDYPVLAAWNISENVTGIDLIYEYLTHISIEKTFLDYFDSAYICQLLSRVQDDYKHLYLDNICAPVLLHTLVSIIIKKPVFNLCLSLDDCQKLSKLIGNETVTEIEYRLDQACHVLCQELGRSNSNTNYQSADYYDEFHPILHDYAFRINHGINNNCLTQVLSAQNYL